MMKTPTCRFLALAAMMILCPVAMSYADSTTPPTAQGATPGTQKTTPDVASSGTMTNTNGAPKLDSKVPPGNDASPSH
jgi:hypothetical protein